MSVVLFNEMGRLSQGVCIAGVIDALLRASYNELTPYERFEYESALARLHASLPECEFTAAWTAGQEMTIDQAQASALEIVPEK